MNRLGLGGLAALPVPIARPDYDIGAVGIGIVHLGLGAFHRAHQAVYTDAILRRHPRWGICGVSLKTPRVIAALTPAGRALHGARKGRRRHVGARDRIRARDAVPRHGARSRDRAHRGSCRSRRLADRHRKGLLPRSGHGPAQRSASRHRARPRAPRGAGERDRRAGGRTGRAARGCGRPAQRRLLRQSSAQRSHRRRHRHGVRADVGSRARRLDRRERRVPVHDGRPDRAGDDGGRHRRGRAAARRRRCRARGRGTVQQLGDREPLRHRRARPGRTPARRSSPTSRRSRR